MESFTFTDFRRRRGKVINAALEAPVILTKRGEPKFVVLSSQKFARLVGPRAESTTEKTRNKLVRNPTGL